MQGLGPAVEDISRRADCLLGHDGSRRHSLVAVSVPVRPGLAVDRSALAVLSGTALVVEGVGAVTGGSVNVPGGQEPVRKAWVSIVVRGAAAPVPLDRRQILIGCPLPAQQRRSVTGIGGVIPRIGRRVTLLCRAQSG